MLIGFAIKFLFIPMDFSTCNPPCSSSLIDKRLKDVLSTIENVLGVNLKINSAFRPISHEVSQGRTGRSSHTLGKAVDVHCYSDRQRFEIVQLLLELGVNRIGIYKTFIHIDIANEKDNKTENVIWVG